MINSVIQVGNLTRDPEKRYTKSGKAVTNFGIAINEGERSYFFNVNCWDNVADNVAEYLHKGSKVAIQGKLTSRQYEYNGQSRVAVEITAFSVEFLDKKGNNTTTNEKPAQSNYDPSQEPEQYDDGLPF